MQRTMVVSVGSHQIQSTENNCSIKIRKISGIIYQKWVKKMPLEGGTKSKSHNQVNAPLYSAWAREPGS